MKTELKMALLLIAICSPPAHADTFCIETSSPPYVDVLSTTPYVAPASTTTLKADLLKGYYRMMWDRDKMRQMWANERDETIRAEKDRDTWKERHDELYRILIGSMTYGLDQP
jgi:hypothetical protein